MTIKTTAKQPLHQTECARNIMRILSKHNVRFTVAGGYARDLMHNKEPRDMDICTFGEEIPLDCVRELCKEHNTVKIYDDEYVGVLMHDDDSIQRVIKIEECNIDIIQYNCETLEDTLLSFDFNINMFALEEPMGTSRYVGISYFGDKVGPQGTLHVNKQRGHTIAEERRLYMLQKADNLGWAAGD